jgi:putative DNA primase/helicase
VAGDPHLDLHLRVALSLQTRAVVFRFTAMSKQKHKRFSRTDTGNAELFAYLYGGTVLFDHARRRWLIWNASRCRWTDDGTNQVCEFAKKAAQYRYVMAGKLPNGTEEERNEQKREAGWALGSQSLYRINAALELVKSVPTVADAGDEWDADPWLFGVANGIIDLRTGKLRTATQKDRITKFSPVAVDPSAKCPRFKQFLQEVFDGDSELIRFVQKAAGYTLTGSTQEQCLFACYGTGSNGKTTLLEILLFILGDYGVDLPFSALETKQYVIGEGAHLPGARFAKSVEAREGRRLDEARIKSWTGSDTISIRLMHRNTFSFQPTHKLWLSFNHRPVISDDSPAMWRRIRLIPFLRAFDPAQADKRLPEKLKTEAPGILNWLIEGCLTWQKDGLKVPVAVELATREYEAESDPLAPFLADCCEMGPAFKVIKGDLCGAYQGWCALNKERPVSRNAFAEKLKSRGFGEGSTGSARFWTGLRRRTTDTTDTTKSFSEVIPIGNDPLRSTQKKSKVASVASAENAIKAPEEGAETSYSTNCSAEDSKSLR